MLLRQLRNIFAKPMYVVLAVFVAWLVFTFAVWLPNFNLVGIILKSDTASIYERLSFLFSLYGSIGTNFTFVSASYTIAMALLFGINISSLIYYVRKMRGDIEGIKSTSAVGLGGMVAGFFGIGCVTCGTFILTSAFALFGTTWLLTFLPFGGTEFGFLGVALLLYSIYALVKKIEKSGVCEIT